MCRDGNLFRGPAKLGRRFYSAVIDKLLPVDCGSTGVTMKMSLIWHHLAGIDILAARKLGRGIHKIYLVYED